MKIVNIFCTLALVATKASNPWQVAAAATGYSLRRRQQQESKPVTTFPDGIWTVRGYGWVVNVTNNGTDVNLIEETEISCIPNNLLLHFLDLDRVLVDGEVAHMTASAAILTNFTLDRTDSYRGGCNNGITPNVNSNGDYVEDPLLSFDIMVQTFAEHFAFFDIRNLNWTGLAAEARATLTSNSTEEELWEATTDLLEKLEDPHVSLVAASGEAFRSKDSDETTTMLYEEFEQQNEIEEFEDYINSQISKWRDAVATYMVDGKMFGGEPGGIVWGRFQNCDDAASVDFSRVDSLGDVIDEIDGALDVLGYCTPKKVGYMEVPAFATDDKAGFFGAIDSALEDLSDTDTLVLDIRLNPGGFDPWGVLLASNFASTRTHAFSKRARYDHDKFTSWQRVYIDPDDSPNTNYSGDIILITSGRTISAAETFTLAMSQLPHVTILGRPTIGAFSDQLQKVMPNGWLFSVSNEEYAAPDGSIYEVVGYPPDVLTETVLASRADRANGTDSWLDQALEMAKGPDPLFSSAADAFCSGSAWAATFAIAFVGLLI
ncbi:Peptidase family S41 [Seminavis robusta]|uniref:Peptidase family S41 n=1 Tax=Seminavis robusta TaxID=568900 RepID=A0A9N8DHW3_9STRA|nr:Peptidase family S41 [Seminavis robusta]|eukprot:Sro96_g049490.1 Peptidase family S41 (546) ;mRNA; f:29719-31356